MCGLTALLVGPCSINTTGAASNMVQIDRTRVLGRLEKDSDQKWTDADAASERLAVTCLEHLANRGPDHSGAMEIIISGNKQSTCRLILAASVLQLQGKHGAATPQPACHSAPGQSEVDVALLWNGEVFGGDIRPSDTGDTSAVLAAVADAICPGNVNQSARRIVAVLEGIRGPFAFSVWDASNRTLWYGRDRIGRRSLVGCMGSSQGDDGRDEVAFVLSSATVSPLSGVEQWSEVATTGIFSMTFKCSDTGICGDLRHHPWSHVLASSPSLDSSLPANLECCPQITQGVLPFARTTAIASATEQKRDFSETADRFLKVLSDAVAVRVQTICAPPDTEHARVGVLFSGGVDCSTIAALAHHHLPATEPIDLINVAFVGEGKLSRSDIDGRVPDRATAISAFHELQRAAPQRQWRLIEVDVSLEELEKHRSRVLSLIAPATTVMDFNIGSVLWFGSRACGSYHPKRCLSDAAAGAQALRYKTDISSIASSTAPQSNEDPLGAVEYTSRAHVLLVGIGADEQLAGYSRHRQVFQRHGWEGLRAELNKDCQRLWSRNLGRDDRVVSDHGREARHPFLDERVMEFLRNTPLDEICDLTLAPGIGDKRIIREVAARLGLPGSGALQKRAIQFGTRIANPKVPGTETMNRTRELAAMVNPQMLRSEPQQQKSQERAAQKAEEKKKRRAENMQRALAQRETKQAERRRKLEAAQSGHGKMDST